MLDNKHINQIYEMTDDQAEKIKEIIINITRDIKYKFKKNASSIIVNKKEPYLKEILETYQNNTPLENKYNASDILTILETIFDELKLSEFDEYHENIESIENQDFTCAHCKNIISLESNQNLTKNDFNYCPHCGKPIKN